KLLSENGWHTSYYLPTGKIIELLENGDKNELQDMAKAISNQVLSQETKAVSFDTRLYKFVKEYLGKLLPDHMVYHAWYGPKLFDTNFIDQINNIDIYKDQRIKTFLIPYRSEFNL